MVNTSKNIHEKDLLYVLTHMNPTMLNAKNGTDNLVTQEADVYSSPTEGERLLHCEVVPLIKS